MPLQGFLPIVVLVLVIVGIVSFIRWLFGGGTRRGQGRARSPGLDVLDERYAKGEIERDEYQRKRRDLGG